MILLQEKRYAQPVPCPYLEGRVFVQEYFFAEGLDEEEFDWFLIRGWRRFGRFFFRPACPGCRACTPVRLDAQGIVPTPSQKRVMRKNRETRVVSAPLQYDDRLFDLYSRHSLKFGDDDRDRSDFEETYFQRAVPSFQTEYYIGEQLGAVGFIDVSSSGFSSVYFSYDPRFSPLSLGTFSILKESELVRDGGLSWYYLGYYIEECPRMAYKGKFHPRQFYNWDRERWEDG